jgi:hypothetical protein
MTMSFERLRGVIRIGDEFEWCPHGHEGWPHASCRIRVTRICAWGDDERPCTEEGDDHDDAGAAIESIAIGKGTVAWVELGRFRDNCRRIPKCEGSEEAP